MPLHLLDFDCSEDAEGVVCWDALAQPLPQHNSALLREVAQVLDWAHRFDAQGPGPLEDGAQWDYDVQVVLQRDDGPPQPVQARFEPAVARSTGSGSEALTLSPAPGPQQRIALSLSLSGTPGFTEAFQAQFELP